MSTTTQPMPVRRGLLIGGTEAPATAGRTTPDFNPMTGTVYAEVPAADPSDVERAIGAAYAASPGWAATAPSQRGAILQRAADVLEQKSEEFAHIMLSETSGTRTWAGFNVRMSSQLLRQAATMATEQTGRLLATDVAGQWSMAVGAPAGVVVAFTPWNGPLILCARAISVALATGNPVVIRPSEDSPITAGLFIADALGEAGIPPGVVNVITNDRADAPAIVESLIADPRVRRVNFTGSTRVGRIVGASAGQHLKPVILELGGKNPIVVLDDADIEYAASGTVLAKFMNAGQICLCVDRVIVQRPVAEAFTAALVAKVAALKQGDPSDQRTIVGPLINQTSAEHVASLVDDAVAKGARVLCGGKWPGGTFYPATLLDAVTTDMRIYGEEVFGPAGTIFTVDSEEEAIAVANDTSYGLASAVYTENATRGLRVARQLRHGAVHVNDQTVADEPQAPVGGVKDSGFGHFGSQWGAEFFTETRWITVADNHTEYPAFS
jgi:acyl-CoA reductase-like NAD-dependent aldehyde dehydrogenase